MRRNKITFLAWSPDDAGIKVSLSCSLLFGEAWGLYSLALPPTQAKMIYASSKEALKRSLNGIATELQANDPDDIEYDTVLKTVSKGLA